MPKQLLLIIVLFLSLGYINAQEVTFRASAPNAVAKDETFRLVYTLHNAQGEEIKAASSIKGFDVLFGPGTSRSYSTQVINGRASSSSSEAYSYTLMATTEGTFTIPAATITAEGKTYTSNTLTIKVLPADKSSQTAQGQGGGQPAATSSADGGTVKSTDAFIRAIVSKTRVREQEAFIVTFRFYTTLDVRDIGKIEFPEFEGFMVEDQDLPGARQLTMEHYNGRNYNSVDLRKTLLFPQRSGEITIPAGKIEMVFSVRSGKTVETFFGPQYVMSDVRKVLTTSPLKINVSELPAGKPDGFSNGVGSFSITESISATNIKANDPVTISMVISGTGNMKLIRTPELKLPTDFESYDPKINNDLRFTDNGLSGKKTIEYLFIPRHHGTYTIPPMKLSYFDTRSNSYKTLSTPEYKLNVEKDPNAGSKAATSFGQTTVKEEQDIRHIKTREPSFLKTENGFVAGSLSFYLWYIIPLLLFVIFFVTYRKQIKENADVIRMKTKHANKLAIKRLKQAEVYLNADNKEQFYEEALRATWGYLSDKLVIPVANLNRDNIESELGKYGAGHHLIDKFMRILDTCEFARYAPAESDTAMSTLYQDTVNAIGEMESSKNKKVASK